MSHRRPHDVGLYHFLCAQLAFWLLAATDGHARNFSIFLLPGGGYRMTPLYDVISVWPVIVNGPNLLAWQEARLAMAVRSKNVHDGLARIQTPHWQGVAERSGAKGTWEAMQALVASVEPTITRVQMLLPTGLLNARLKPSLTDCAANAELGMPAHRGSRSCCNLGAGRLHVRQHSHVRPGAPS